MDIQKVFFILITPKQKTFGKEQFHIFEYTGNCNY
jgi:hypothetical protein